MIVNLADAKRENGELVLEIKKEIDKSEVDNLYKSLESLKHYKQIRNLYRISVDNGNELIRFLKIIYDSNCSKPFNNSDKIIMEGNRLLANYSSFIGMLIDQIEKVLSNIESRRIKQFRSTCSDLYNNNFEYRFFIIMRNFILHYDLPFTFYSESFVDGRKLELQKEHLLRFAKWKHVKEDLIKMDDRINVLPMIHPMNVNLTVLFFDFIYNLADKLIYAYEKAGEFIIRHGIKNPAVVSYESIEEFKNGNMNVSYIDFTNLQDAFNDIKAHPKIELKINDITPDWLKNNH